jgi:hypothetical protein
MEMPLAWLQLLAQLQHLIEETEGSDARRALRCLGRDRYAAAQRQLRLQQARLMVEAARWGIAVDSHLVSQAARTLPRHDDLGAEYLSLASSFTMATEVARQRGNARLEAWLSQRARLHAEHKLLLGG